MNEVLTLDKYVKMKVFVIVYLVNSFQLKGFITGYDSKVIILVSADGKEHMIYKHAISTIEPGRE